MVPIKTAVEDIQRMLGYLGKQIGWVDPAKVEKALGKVDDRKIGAMVEFGLLLRDGGNLRTTSRGQLFNTDPAAALLEVVRGVELYSATIEWIHYGKKPEVTAAEIGQYWEASHKDTLGGVMGSTLRDGAITFGRVADGAGLGSFLVGRAGKETRIEFDASALDTFVNREPVASADGEDGAASKLTETSVEAPVEAPAAVAATPVAQALPVPPASQTVSLSTSPSVHVNVEIHIAADATADTVREIFKNMARYILDKPIADDDQ